MESSSFKLIVHHPFYLFCLANCFNDLGLYIFLICFLIGDCSTLNKHSATIISFCLLFSEWFLLLKCFCIDFL